MRSPLGRKSAKNKALDPLAAILCTANPSKPRPRCLVSVMEWKQLPYKYPKPDLNSDTVVRQSTINQITLCGYRKLLEGQEGYLDAVSEPMAYGSCVHYIIARHLELGEIPHDDIQNMDTWVGEMLENDYNWSLSQIPSPRDFFAEIEASYAQWRSVVLPTLPRLITQEQEMWMYLGEGRTSNWDTDTANNIYLKGTPDAVFECKKRR